MEHRGAVAYTDLYKFTATARQHTTARATQPWLNLQIHDSYVTMGNDRVQGGADGERLFWCCVGS